MDRNLSVFLFAFTLAFFVALLWCLWRLPQENSDYPDGFAPRVNSKIILADKHMEIEGTFNLASQHIDAVADATKMEQEATSTISTDVKAVEGLRAIKLQDGLNTQSSLNMGPIMRVTSSYFGQERDPMLSILIALMCLVVLILTLIALIIACAYWKIIYSTQRRSNMLTCCDRHVVDSEEYLPVLPILTDQTDSEMSNPTCIDEIMVTSPAKTLETVDLTSITLAEIPLDLEDLLIKKLDVRRNGERFHGWQKVGAEFGIGRDDLNLLVNEYKKDAGSPTKAILEILSSQGRSVADLVEVLTCLKVNYPDIAELIKKYIIVTKK